MSVLLRSAHQCPICKEVWVIQADQLSEANLKQFVSLKETVLYHEVDCAVVHADKLFLKVFGGML